MGRECSINVTKKRNFYKSLFGKPQRNRPLTRKRLLWVDNIKMNLGELGSGGLDWD
jgi:hypothetical protein